MPRPDMSRVNVSAAMRARDVSRPSPEEVRAAEEEYDFGRERRERRRTHRGGGQPSKADQPPKGDRQPRPPSRRP